MMPVLDFKLEAADSSSQARLGTLTTAHGAIATPAFMPVGTRAAVKTLLAPQLTELGAQIILGNTYHLMLRPGQDILEQAGGLHRFMQWQSPILTDSGGFQVFSLAALSKISAHGVTFQSHIDGQRLFLGPKESMSLQKTFGSDIVMAFDQCTPHPCSRNDVEEAMERTHRWAEECRAYPLHAHQQLFGIVQGGMYADLRRQSAEALVAMDFPGYAIGGLSVGEPAELMYELLDVTTPLLPENKPRYLMGVGTPRNLIEAVRRGVDMFDCVMPTRNARNGTAFTWSGKLNLKAGRYAADFSPIDPDSATSASRYSKAYVRHLLNVGEITGLTLMTLQNIGFYLDLMRRIRQAIRNGTLEALYRQICQIYPV
jgi:queuine tRNA-ribosyltransferase